MIEFPLQLRCGNRLYKIPDAFTLSGLFYGFSNLSYHSSHDFFSYYLFYYLMFDGNSSSSRSANFRIKQYTYNQDNLTNLLNTLICLPEGLKSRAAETLEDYRI